MRSTHALLAVAASAAALLLPAAAPASVTTTYSLQAPAAGVATDGAGRVHVIESNTQTDAIFNPDGTLFRRVALPGTPGTAGNAERAADGSVWVAIAATDATAGVARVTTDGAVVNVPLSGLVPCGPTNLVAAGERIAFTSPGFDSCASGGVGTISGFTPSLVSSTESHAYDLAYAYGALFVPNYDTDSVDRLVGSTVDATFRAPAGSGPDELVAAPDGNIYMTLYDGNAVVRFSPSAPNGSAVSAPLVSGLITPSGLADGPYDTVVVGDEDGGTITSIPMTGSPTTLMLPTDFAPEQMTTAGNDLWVTDLAAARVAVITDDKPALTGLTANAATAAVTVDARGNATHVVFVVRAAGAAPDAPPQLTANGSTVLGSSRSMVAAGRFPTALPAGDWVVTAHATNSRGSTDATVPVHVDGTPAGPGGPGGPGTTTPPVRITPPTARAPRFADLVRVAAPTRCVTGRHVLVLQLRRQPPARTIATVTVRVGAHKAHRYLARELRHGLQLRRLPARGSYRVTITVRLSSGRTYRRALTYKACRTRRH